MTQASTATPTDDFVRQIDVHSILPQQEPFVMIGRLEHFDMRTVRTSTEVTPDNMFVEDGRLSAAGLIENIAQTSVARIGYINRYILRKNLQIGFLGAVRNFKVSGLPMVGERFFTEVNVVEEVFGMLLATAAVSTHDRAVATTEIKIAVK